MSNGMPSLFCCHCDSSATICFGPENICIYQGLLLEISVDGPKAHQQKYPWALIGPGSGVQGQRPGRGSQGGEAPRAENDSSIAGSLYLSSPWHVCSYFQHVVHSKFTLKNQTILWPNIFSTKLQKKFENMFWQSPKLLPTGSSFTSRQLNWLQPQKLQLEKFQ